MQTVRRLYLYLMSGVTLGVLGGGLTLLAEVILRELGFGRGAFVGGGPTTGPLQVSLGAALIGVGLPVWLIHWWLVERGLRPTSPTLDAERGSAVRALYFTLVLSVTLVVAVTGAASLVRSVGHAVAGVTPAFVSDDPAGALPPTIVGATIWLYHWAIRRRDMRVGPLAGAAAWLPRLYLYGAAAVGMVMALEAIGNLAGLAADVVAPVGVTLDQGDYRRIGLVDAVSAVFVWGTVWLGHWWYLARTTRGTDWRAASERLSRVRLAYFVGVVALSAGLVLLDLVQAGRAILVALLGATDALGIAPGQNLLVREVVSPIASAMPWAGAGWIHLGWLRGEAGTSEESGRAEHVERLESHALALVGLGFGAVGLAWLVGLLLDVALGGQRTIQATGFWQVELAQFVPLVVLGSALWLWSWRRVLARRAADPTTEALSTVRRGALLLTMAGAVLGGLGSAAVVLYRLVAAVLGADVSGDPVSELSTPLGVLIVALAVAAYHGVALSQDLAMRAAAAEAPSMTPAGMPPASVEVPPAPAELPPVPAEVMPGAAPVSGVHRALVLAGPPGADLDAVLDALRHALPADHTLGEGTADPG